MADFTFRISPNIILGSYTASRLGQFALDYGNRFMLIMDPVLRAVGLAEKITQSLTDRNVDYFVFDELSEIADTKTVAAALELARKSHIHGVIAAGGGKTMNVARAVCSLFYENQDIYDYTDGRISEKEPLPLITLATTCREPFIFTDKIPLVDSRNSQCVLFKAHNALCKIAVFDPNMSVTLTENQSESMALEALCFASEAYLSQKATFFSDMFAEKAVELLNLVGIIDAEKRMKNYPHQLSGGMRQRIVIAIALSCEPKILICDEPTTALDVTIQAKILNLIKDIQAKMNLSVIYITHDLGVMAKVADFVNVMYAGKIIEVGTVDEIFYDPRHPYTWGLISAMPDLETSDDRLYSIPGSPPNLLHEPTGDAFAARNKFAMKIDEKAAPPMFQISETHYAATWLLHPDAPKIELPTELKSRLERARKAANL
mgnify:CR=1 FL=1